MKELKVMADCQCHPVWDMSPEMYGDIDPNALSISDGLKRRLADWAGEFDEALNMEDPENSGFRSVEAATVFKEQGGGLQSSYEAKSVLTISFPSKYELPQTRIEFASKRGDISLPPLVANPTAGHER
ncbi:hypothetical protein [Burkholderia diffusa]|uniref:hypothetical protein n=1 Tax=Burkholderia diffusa TaxID=488732 RepID=UPI00157A7740|nr:hypothetical protein [Burkholderia diffusa]NTY38015.1 hypothetical protein [Burkholderia diffusa]